MHPSIRLFLTRYSWLYELLWRLIGHQDLEKRVFLRCLQAGETVLDVGANRGYFTLLFSNRVGPGGQVYAFEPVPPTFDRLSNYLAEQKQYNNVQLMNLALSDTTGPTTIYLPDADDGQASMTQQAEVGSWLAVKQVTAYTCAMMRLDDYVAEQQLEKIDFIKIDVEGAELSVLRGAIKSLKTFQPILHLEICSAWTKQFGYQPIDLVSLLQPLGYTDYYLYGASLHRLVDPATELDPETLPISANLLCAIPAIHQPRLQRLSQLLEQKR